MLAILRKEFIGFLYTPVGYIVLTLFLIGTGLFVWVFPQTSVLDYGFADLNTFFSLTPYVFLFLIPGITMRSLADEKKAGTMELLLTHPPSEWGILMGKYLAAWLLVGVALLPTLVYVQSVYLLGAPQGNLDLAAVTGSYIGLFLLGGVFTAIGIFASSLTQSQIGAFVGALFLCFFFYEGFSSLAKLEFWNTTGYILEQISVASHYQAMGRGLIDSRDIIYFLSLMVLFLVATKTILSSRKW